VPLAFPRVSRTIGPPTTVIPPIAWSDPGDHSRPRKAQVLMIQGTAALTGRLSVPLDGRTETFVVFVWTRTFDDAATIETLVPAAWTMLPPGKQALNSSSNAVL
jgi:hypothetical protein